MSQFSIRIFIGDKLILSVLNFGNIYNHAYLLYNISMVVRN